MSGMSNHAKTLIITPERTPFFRREMRGLPVRSKIMPSRAREGSIARPLRRSAAAETLPTRFFSAPRREAAPQECKKKTGSP